MLGCTTDIEIAETDAEAAMPATSQTKKNFSVYIWHNQ
jgi:hypothetical protein